MKKLLIILPIISAILGFTIMAQAKQDTCPQDGDWTKIDSGDLSGYPVEGAIEYCFKAGNWLEFEYPEGGFGQDGSCKNGIKFCELSHWAYRMGEPTPTVTPTTEPTPTSEPTPTDDPEVTPTDEPTATPTQEPTATPTVEPTVTPEPTDEPEEDDSEETVREQTEKVRQEFIEENGYEPMGLK